MLRNFVMAALCGTLFVFPSAFCMGQETHNHPVPERLGDVSFPTTCKPVVQKEFERAIALLHSFAYSAAENSFENVVTVDPNCAIAHWGAAMTHFHQLWDPPLASSGIAAGQQQIRRAQEARGASDREHRYIDALAIVYDGTVSYPMRISAYEAAMKNLAAVYGNDVEAQVFYALALLAAASPLDKTHARQKQAVAILEPLYQNYPDHPGIAHYLIHACDNGELASRGLSAAQAYSQIAPSAPHALHMPSHIFTRLGMWNDSIDSNLAAKEAAHQQGDLGEELHAMDYLVYAYLQEGREKEAGEVIQQLRGMQQRERVDFKVAYASLAMPVRYAVERRQWQEAAHITGPRGAPPHVMAVAVWARALGLARSGRATEAGLEVDELRRLEGQLHASGNEYWAKQVAIQTMEARAWTMQTQGVFDSARNLLRQAADEEDAIEKLPVTPGPIIPAREQLGELLLVQNQPRLAANEFEKALNNAPNRRAALDGLARAGRLSTNHR